MFSTALEQDLSVFSFAEMALFTNSVHIELILPQAVQLCIHFLLRKNKDGCTSLRDLIKDTPLRDIRRRNNSVLGRNQIHDLKSFASRRVLYHCATAVA